ncbi:MAG: hypothetical protein ACOX2U_07765 [Limisphaerales bacterium]|jgi:hypothetical protein
MENWKTKRKEEIQKIIDDNNLDNANKKIELQKLKDQIRKDKLLYKSK